MFHLWVFKRIYIILQNSNPKDGQETSLKEHSSNLVYYLYKVVWLPKDILQKESSKLKQQRLRYLDFFVLGVGRAPEMVDPTIPIMQLDNVFN